MEPTAPRALLKLRDISKSYHRGAFDIPALRGITLAFNTGDFVGISGPSGSGKSTLLNIIGLTESPDHGEMTLDDVVVNFSNSEALRLLRRSSVGYIFQAFNLLSGLSAAENVAISLILNQETPSAALTKARSLLAEVGLGARTEHLPHQLSGGEMQRVAVCRAIIHQPKVILADEPTGNLDSLAGGLVLDILKTQARQGVLILMASHNSEALGACSRVVQLRDGVCL